MTITVEEFHDELKKITMIIRSKGLGGEAIGHVNYIGDEIDLRVNASEDYDKNGYWSRGNNFIGAKADTTKLLTQAQSWAYNLPNEEDRAIEFMIQQLNLLVEKLPKGHGAAASQAWEEIGKMLLARAASLAKSGLPSPTSIFSTSHVGAKTVDDEIPF